jgi:polyhydroxyalkanoate synthesis regulator phasin
MTNPDPGAFFREMLGQWESVANQFGTELMKSGEFARTMHGATSAATRAQEVAKEAMSRALAAANMPSREELAAIGERMSALEERLSRIESLLIKLAGQDAAPKVERPKPARTKKPPQQAG